MEYTIVITKEPESPWRAFVPLFPGCRAEAETRDEALAQIKEQITQRHFEVVRVEVPDSGDVGAPNGNVPGNVVRLGSGSIKDFIGIFQDDPSWGAMFDEIERRRTEPITSE